MHKLLHPHHLLLPAGLLTAFLFLFSKAATIDIHVHDTYLIIGTKFFWGVTSGLLLLLWLLYTGVSGILLSKKLVWLHVVITIVAIAFITAILLWAVFYHRHDSADYYTFGRFQMQQDTVAVSFLLLIAGQFLFVINLMGGIISRLKKR